MNFLTNESLENEINIDTIRFQNRENTIENDKFIQNEREGIVGLKSSLNQAHLIVKPRKSAYLPIVKTFIDAGFQSTYLQFNTDSRYLLGGVSLK